MTPETLAYLTQSLVDALTVILLTLIPALIVYAIGQFNAWADRNKISHYVRIAVQAAEQLYKSKQITDRKKYAVDYLTEALAARGIRIPLDELVAAIESAVFDYTYSIAQTIK